MRLRQIEVFYAVYSAGSISKAGELLGVSQPAISKVIRHTEDLLGYKLFDRVASGIVPTQEAIELFESAAKVFAEVNRFRGRATSMHTKSGVQAVSLSAGDEQPCDAVVVCTGVAGTKILKGLDIKLPIYPVMPAALAGLYSGQNVGKQLCRVRGEPEDWR